jgi:prepilin-type N-terminal cleavage/methylation domain-containing protein
MKNFNNQQGFTIVELLVGMAIFTIIMAAVLSVLSTSIKSQQYNFDQGANIQDARAILNKASEELRNVTFISSPEVNQQANAITYRKSDDTIDCSIALGTGADVGYILFTNTAGVVQRLGAGRVSSIDLIYEDVSGRKKITLRIQVQNSARTGAPLTDLTTSVVTFNPF